MGMDGVPFNEEEKSNLDIISDSETGFPDRRQLVDNVVQRTATEKIIQRQTTTGRKMKSICNDVQL